MVKVLAAQEEQEVMRKLEKLDPDKKPAPDYGYCSGCGNKAKLGHSSKIGEWDDPKSWVCLSCHLGWKDTNDEAPVMTPEDEEFWGDVT